MEYIIGKPALQREEVMWGKMCNGIYEGSIFHFHSLVVWRFFDIAWRLHLKNFVIQNADVLQHLQPQDYKIQEAEYRRRTGSYVILGFLPNKSNDKPEVHPP